ncbi:MAG: c-type cytochrome [Deltaproteobacteria bacterium]|nr:c-type cytochrome [Deltaproteobacteria bacterium]MBW1876682.1 c-type cytochrome [Deltaproteobacteria bacterium]MBW2212184.1 c-type cytochrome [Deltaproteobacteria bacterium]MBW2628562.1 c-type cytochrome [Deltaproteobacteria bacterium]MBW2686863.1 c-type cytochrome [Deltaproteobacteria bacterium]
MRARWIGLLIGLIIGVSGCTSKDTAPAEPKAAEPAPAPTPAAEPAADPVADAAAIYENRCTVCHGMSGKGDGDGSAALDPKPRDFTLAEWQASVTDDHLKKIIVFGGLAVGKAATMPPNPDLDAKPEVVAELVKLIRDLAK